MKSELITYNKPKSSVAESFRTLRTNLSFTFNKGKVKVVMITSSVPAEGKSFISANLASAYALDGLKVLLVDCDLRKGRLHKIFKLENDKGLSNLLIGNINECKDYICKTDIKGLHVLPSGTVPPNPSELLGTIENKKLFEELRNQYDLIIIDCPPVTSIADAVVLTSIADEAVLVCKYKYTDLETLNETKKNLEQSGIKIAGAIINYYEQKNDKKYYYYNGYYANE